MRLSRFVGKRIKENPKDAQSPSHIFLLRGGYIRPVSTGIYSLLPLAKRITLKIEKIIREEMNAIEGQEVLMPVVLPRELWEESGRYQSVGPELLRLKDRNQKDMLLGMTHEEAVVHLARSEVSSYKQLPFMLYQIQTKYRDEARPRAGLIRVREFTMKDAYSFHATKECLKKTYDQCFKAYERIFKRIGMTKVVSIESDTGMMGGDVSHEFMAIADCGEDTLFLSQDGAYRANKEIARTGIKFETRENLKKAEKPLEKVETPNQKTIEDLAKFLKISIAQTGKAVFYRDHEGKLVFAAVRGDFEVNETKLKKALMSPTLSFAGDVEIRAAGAEPGYASPLGLDPKKVRIVCDPSFTHSSNLVVGANKVDWHLLNFNFLRDMADVKSSVTIADIVHAREGDPDPLTGQPMKTERGIEVGNIFQLGTKYSESMKAEYLDKDGKLKPYIMGCYGIGVGRALASVIEHNHDTYGPIWPVSIAPFEVHLCALQLSDASVRETAEKLYQTFLDRGIEAIFDDRDEKPGAMFSEADLMGVPYRCIISPKSLQAGGIEIKSRRGDLKDLLPFDKAVELICGRVEAERRG